MAMTEEEEWEVSYLASVKESGRTRLRFFYQSEIIRYNEIFYFGFLR